jgi:glutathione S-transferase
LAQLAGLSIERRLPADSKECPRTRRAPPRAGMARRLGREIRRARVLPWLKNAHARWRVREMRALRREEDVLIAILREQGTPIDPPEGSMIDLYYWPTPNGHKITLFLEERRCRTRFFRSTSARRTIQCGFSEDSAQQSHAGDHRSLAQDGGAPISVFESGAILLYLAEKTGLFIPKDLRGKVTVTEWLFWQMGGLGPMAGQNHHFSRYAPEKIPYAIERYVKETNRLYGVLNKRLEGPRFHRRRLFDRRHGRVSVDRASRGAGAKACGFSPREALVRGNPQPSGDDQGLCARRRVQHASRIDRGSAQGSIRTSPPGIVRRDVM